MIKKRTSGILLHLTSLPGKHGIGDFGPGAYKFIDFLTASGQSYWQFLPTGPTSTAFDNSPYMCRSVFAGNPLLISLELLEEDRYLSAGDLEGAPEFSEHVTDYPKVTTYKNTLLRKAFEVFLRSEPDIHFENFCHTHKKWLEDYALFMSLKERFKHNPWYEWPDFAARRNGRDFSQFRSEKKQVLLYYKFVQFIFFRQWQKVYDYAHDKNILLIGDIPIYVALDSSDVWANQELFKIDPKTLKPLKVAGVPPDYFSETGQRWGNPVYRWKTADNKNNEKLYDWWLNRFSQIFSIMDMAKIDHFRGFEAYWEIPGRYKTAINGKWTKGPGEKFFTYMNEKLNGLPIIAEDLGVITPPVEKIRDELGFPGMKVLHFAFESDEKNPYLPHNYGQTNSVVYTGTHDNNTTLGWFMGEQLSDEARNRIRRYLNSNDDKNIVTELTCLAMSSIADLAIIPMQDILGFGEDCRMNRPGTQSGNWRWRCSPDFINDEVARYLHDITSFYNRSH
jgi:4-alpha-glucanotransferase